MIKCNLSIYYAHHQWKYGTIIEKYELDLINKYFPNANIFNPSKDINIYNKTEDMIMGECLDTVVNSDVVIFSAVNGMVGKGVYQEVITAKGAGKLVLFITKNTLTTEFTLTPTPNIGTDRLYAEVTDFKRM